MSSWAVPGAKVVCVNNAPAFVRMSGGGKVLSYAASVLNVGGIYTIRAITQKVGLLLVEARTNVIATFGEQGFRIDRFRPLTKSTKTQEEDIAMFWDILAEEGEKV